MSFKLKKIEEFLEQIEEDSPAKPSFSIQLLGKWHKKIEIIFSIARAQKYYHDLMKCVVKYIELIVVNLQATSNKRQLTYSKNFFNKLEALIGPDQKDVFMRDVTEKVLELVTESTACHWGVIKELLKMYCKIIKGATPELRSYTMQQLPDIWLYKLTDSISTFSDYDLQVLIIEVIIFLYGKTYLNSKIRELIPESQELSQQFVGIDPNHFDQDVRNFLNRLNQNSCNVFSIVCDNIKLGDYLCITPLENMEGLWVDFNMINNVISWYCGIGTFDIAEDDKSKAFELITILAEDIYSYIISSSTSGDDIIVKFTLKSHPLNLHDKYKLIMKNTSQCLFMLRNSDDTKKLLSHVLPNMLRTKIIGEEASADNADLDLQSPKRNEKLDRSIYGTDISVKSRDFWDLTKSLNPSSDSFEAISESSVSQHSKRSEPVVAHPQSKSITSKKRLTSPNSIGLFRMPNQVQSLNAIVEESTTHYQVVPDSQQTDKTAALQIGSEDFYTAQEEDVPMSLDLDSMDVNVCEDVALQSQLASFKIQEKENQPKSEPLECRVGMPLKRYDSSITVSDTLESGADIKASSTVGSVENEKKMPRRRRIPLQEQKQNIPVILKDSAESEEVIRVSASIQIAPAEHSLRPSAPTLSDAVLAATSERVQEGSQTIADRPGIKVSQTIEECIVVEQHDDVVDRSSTVSNLPTLPDEIEDADDNNNVDMVINLVTSDTDVSTGPSKKKKTLRKLNSTLSEEIQCTGRSARKFPFSLGVSSGDESFVTQHGKEPKRVLGKVRSGGKSKQISQRTQTKIKNINERSRKIARLNSSVSVEIIEHESKMTRHGVKNMRAEEKQHKAMKALSAEENSSESDAYLEDLQGGHSSSDESVFASSSNAPPNKPEKSSLISQASKKNIVVNSIIEKEAAMPDKDNATKPLKIDTKAREPESYIKDEIAKPPQEINSSNHESIFGASSSGAPSERIDEKIKRWQASFKSSVKSSVNKEVVPVKENAREPDAFLDDEIAIQLQRMHSCDDETEIPVGSSAVPEKIEEKSRTTPQATRSNSAAESNLNKEVVVPGKDKTIEALKVKENSRKSDAFLADETAMHSSSHEKMEEESRATQQATGSSVDKDAVSRKDMATETLNIEENAREPNALLGDDINSSSDESAIAGNASAPPKKMEAEPRITRQTRTKDISVVKSSSNDKEVAAPKKQKSTKTFKVDKHARGPNESLEDDIHSSGDESVIATSPPPKQKKAKSKITLQTKEKNISIVKSNSKDEGVAAPKKHKTTKTLKTNEHARKRDESLGDDMNSSSDESVTDAKSSHAPEKRKTETRLTRQTKAKNISVVKSNSKDKKVAKPKRQKTTKTFKLKEHANKDDISSSDDESVIAGNFNAPPKKMEAESRITRQTKIKNISLVKSSSKDEEVAVPKRHKTTKTLNSKQHASENDINSSGDESLIAGNSSAPQKKIEPESRITRQTKTKNISVVKSSSKDREAAAPKKQKTTKTLKEDEHAIESDESLDDDINSSNDESAADFSALKKRKMQKPKKTRRTTKETEVKHKINYSSDESMLFVRKKKKLRKIESSQTTDGRNSEASEKVVHKKSSQKDAVGKLEDYATEHISEVVKAKNHQIGEERSSSSPIQKSYVDDLLEKLDSGNWGRMSSKPLNKSKSEDEFDKLINEFKDTEHNFEGENVLERRQRESSQRVDHTHRNSDIESHAGSKIVILSNVTIVEARRDCQLEPILECSALLEGEENILNKADNDTEEDIILGTPLENRSSIMSRSKARKSKPRMIKGIDLKKDVTVPTDKSIAEDVVDDQTSEFYMKDDEESGILDKLPKKLVIHDAKVTVSGDFKNTNQEITSTKANSQKIAAAVENINVCGSKQTEIEDRCDVRPDEDADETRNLRKRKNQKQPKSLNEDVNELPTTEIIGVYDTSTPMTTNNDKETIREHAMSKLRKIEGEICIMTDEEVGRTKNHPERGDQKQPTWINDNVEEIKRPRQSCSSTEERATEHIADIIVHREANESHAEKLQMNETLKNDVTNGKGAEDIAIYNTEKQTGAIVKRINVEDDVDVRTEYTNSSVRSRKRRRKLFDETIPWYDVPVPELNVKPHTARTDDEKSVETNDKRNDVRFGSETTASSLKDKNWKGLTLVINQQPQEETSAFRSNARISPVILEDSKRKKNETQMRSAKKVTFENSKNIKDSALSRLEVLEERERKSEARSYSRFGHSRGTKSRGLGAFDDFLQTLLNESKHKSKKTDKSWSYPKRERVTNKSTSRRLSRKKPLDTVMRGEKGDMSPVLKTKRRKTARDDDVTPEFDVGVSRIPPIRSMPERENDALVHDERKEHNGYVPENLEAPEWVANAVQGSKRTELRSSDYQGKYLLMFFYPSNFGYVVAAPKELEDFSAIIGTFKSLNVEVVGCCTNDINVHMELLAQKPNILIPLVADSTLEISMAFRVYVTKLGYNLRAAVFIDPKGMILWRFVLYDVTRSIPVDQLLSVVRSHVS